MAASGLPQKPIKKAPIKIEAKDKLRIDALIRSKGWIIWVRRKNNEPVWRKGNEEMHQNGLLKSLGYDELIDSKWNG